MNCTLSSLQMAGLLSWRPAFLVAGILLLASTGCGPEGGEDQTEFDRSAYLIHTADDVIVPAYSLFAENVLMLRDGCNALQEGSVTSEDVQMLRGQLKDACMAWQHAQLFDFGPATSRALLATTNTFPTDTEEVFEACSLDNWTGGLPSTLNSSGLPALDWMLFHTSAAGTAEWFNQDGGGSLLHLKRLTAFLADEAQAVLAGWTSGYRDEFVASTGTEAGSSMGELLNAFNRVYEANIRKQKLGLPNGIMTFSQTPQPTLVEAPYAATWSVDLLVESLKACSHVYFGDLDKGATAKLGLDDYLKALGNVTFGEGLHDDISSQLESANTALLSLEDPLAEYVVNQQAASFEVYAELQALVVLWKVDMMSSLGVLITYQDNDGD